MLSTKWSFISLRIADQGGGALLVGLGTALGGTLEIFTMRASSGLQERWGLRKVYMLGACVYAGGFLLWGAAVQPLQLVGVAFAMAAVAAASGAPSTSTS